MKLYYSPGACSLATHITMQEAGLQHDKERVDLRSHQTEKGQDFYTVNPKGYVPALQLPEGGCLTEVAVITQYLADRAPEKKLAPPAGTLERYRLQEWLHFIATEIHKSYSPFYKPDTSEEMKASLRDRIASRFKLVAENLEGKKYLMGDDFTVADAYLFVMLFWSKNLGPDIQQWPALAAYFDRVATRPAVKAALSAEGLDEAA